MNPKARLPWHVGRDRARRQNQKLKMQGLPALIPTERVAKHIDELVSAGITESMIARAAGITPPTISKIRNRNYPNVTVLRADAILAVTVHPHPAQSFVLAIGAHRRIEALQALGWTLPDLEDRMGMQGLRRLVRRQELCTYPRWVQVRVLYDELSATEFDELPGVKAAHARELAKRKGWLLPMEWEGYDIDDPRVNPPRSRRTRKAAKGAEHREQRLEQVAELVRVGLSEVEIAARLRVTDRTVARDKAHLREVAS